MVPFIGAYMLSHFNHVWLFVTLWTVTHQTSLPMEYCRQEYWSELPCPLLEDYLNAGMEPYLLCLLHWQTGSLSASPTQEAPGSLLT